MVTSSAAHCSTQERQPIGQLIEAANTREHGEGNNRGRLRVVVVEAPWELSHNCG